MVLITSHPDLSEQGGAYVHLSPNEFQLLSDLAQQHKIPVTEIFKKTLIQEIVEGNQDIAHKEYIPRKNLSGREHEIVRYIKRGYKNKEIAQRMFITEQTVKNHLRVIFYKVGVGSRTSLA